MWRLWIHVYDINSFFKKSINQYSSLERKPQYRPVSPDMYIYLQTCTLQATATKRHSDERGHATLQRYYWQCFRYSLTVLEWYLLWRRIRLFLYGSLSYKAETSGRTPPFTTVNTVKYHVLLQTNTIPLRCIVSYMVSKWGYHQSLRLIYTHHQQTIKLKCDFHKFNIHIHISSE